MTLVSFAARTGVWEIDPTRSHVRFAVKHMLVSTARGRLTGFSGEIVTGTGVADVTVSASVDAATVDTGVGLRDAYLRDADPFDLGAHPRWTFRSTGLSATGRLDGELTIKGVTRPVALTVTLTRLDADRARFAASTTVHRSDFGVVVAGPGGAVADRVRVDLEIEAVLRPEG